MSSRVCLIIYDLPVYISSCLFSLMLSGLLVIPGVSCLWVLPCPVLSCPVLSCPVLSCPVLSCPVLSCPVLSCPVLSCHVLPCPVMSCLDVLLNIIIWVYILVCVFLFLPRVCTVTQGHMVWFFLPSTHSLREPFMAREPRFPNRLWCGWNFSQSSKTHATHSNASDWQIK